MKKLNWMGTVLAAALLAAPCQAQPGGGGPSPVVVSKLVEEDVAPTLALPGTALPIQRAKVSSMIAGVVVERLAFFAQPYKKGDVLVKLDSVRARARADAARAQAAEARAHHELLAAGERPETIATRRAEVARVRSALTNAQKDHERVSNLFSKNAISENELDQAKAKLDGERANLDAAEANLKMALAGSRPQEVAGAKAAAERAAAMLAEAEKELEDTTVRAPFDGRVAEVFVEVGDHVQDGGPIMELVDLSSLDVAVLVPEGRASDVPVGARAELEFPSGEGTRRVTGTVVAVGPQANIRGRTVAVVVRFRNEGETIRSGASAAVRLPVGKPARRLVVPKDAVVRSASAPPMVYTVADGKANPKPVQLGDETGSGIVVLSGLSAGDVVVTRGNERLRPGAPVQISTAAAPGR